MVCLRCKLLVQDEIEKLHLEYEEVKLGEAVIKEPVAPYKLQALTRALLKAGLEIIDDKKSRLVEQIKAAVIEQVHYSEEPLVENFSSFFSRKAQLRLYLPV